MMISLPQVRNGTEARAEAVQAALERGQLTEALFLQEAAARAAPASAARWYTLGLIHEKLAALEEARAAFEQAVQLDPSDGSAVVALARAEFELGLEARALARIRDLGPEQLSDTSAAEECICRLLEMGEVTYAMQLLDRVALKPGFEMRMAAASLIGGQTQLASVFFRTGSEKYHYHASSRCGLIPLDRPRIEFAPVPADDSAGRPGDMVVEVYRGKAQIAFTGRFRRPARSARCILLRRAAVTIPLLWGASSLRRGKHTSRVSLSDRGVPKMLSFCGTDESHLIPDPVFMGSFGYDSFREFLTDRVDDWQGRQSIVFWRGTATGFAGPKPKVYGTDYSWSPRLNLCQQAQQSQHADMMDVGITKIPEQFRKDPVSERKKLEQFMRPYVRMERQLDFKYAVDVDGWANAWSALFKKLLMGVAVLKVSSSNGFRQWYYDRLVPFDNFIPVKSDISDLDDVIAWAESHPEETEQIATKARQLALSMTFAEESSAAVRRVADINNG